MKLMLRAPMLMSPGFHTTAPFFTGKPFPR